MNEAIPVVDVMNGNNNSGSAAGLPAGGEPGEATPDEKAEE